MPASALSNLLAQGHRKIGIFVWNEAQRVPAGMYLAAHKTEIAAVGADVSVRVSVNRALRNGHKYHDLTVIRYHFGGGSGGGVGK